jgi:hypothetical protein
VGSKSSTSSTNTTQDFVTNNVDNRVSDGDIGGNINVNLSDISTNQESGLSAGVGSVNLAITTSDFGALDAASEISDNAFAFSSQAANQLGAVTASAIDKANKFGDAALGLASEATRDEAARTTQLLIIAGALVVGAFVIRKVIK